MGINEAGGYVYQIYIIQMYSQFCLAKNKLWDNKHLYLDSDEGKGKVDNILKMEALNPLKCLSVSWSLLWKDEGQFVHLDLMPGKLLAQTTD